MVSDDTIRITLLGKPQAKERPRGTRAGVFYTPDKTRNYEAALRYAASEVMADRPPLEGPLHLEMTINVPVPQSWPKKRRADALSGLSAPTSRPDLDNFYKCVDACNLIVWVDDSQIVHAVLRKTYSDKPGFFMVVRPRTVGVLG